MTKKNNKKTHPSKVAEAGDKPTIPQLPNIGETVTIDGDSYIYWNLNGIGFLFTAYESNLAHKRFKLFYPTVTGETEGVPSEVKAT